MGKRGAGKTPPESSEPDPEDELITATLMTSVFTGIGFVVSVIIYSMFGTLALKLAWDGGRVALMITFAVGLALAAGMIAFLLRHFAEQIKARSLNLYRGAWIGSAAGLVIIVLMYYMPWIVIPQYCPPGSIC